jgi:NAD(P)-dependent dehydrogenase (short-subunit alcohol dehydrogenase family)
MSKSLDGKVALITGGNSGIGLATAQLFLQEGARVAISGRERKTLDAAQQKLGPESLVVQTNVSNLAQLDAMYQAIDKHYGRLDIIFANAGVAIPCPLEQMSEERFDSVFDINVKGTYFTVQKALPYLKTGATIILNASIAQYTGVPGLSAYGASKAAVRALARLFAAELASRGIRVNVVTPGPIATPIWGRVEGASGLDPETEKRLVARVPLARMGQPEEVARAVLFLASDASSYTTGCEIMVDGGVVDLPAAAPGLRSGW